MRRLLVAFATLIAVGCGESAVPSDGRVVRILDGDTVEVLQGRDPVRIRLHGIDAPERGQDYGSRSQEALAYRIFQKTVVVQKMDTDRYGRLVGRIWLDGEDINLWMIANGWAWHYRQYDDNPFYAEAERMARVQRRGLWSGTNIVPPWDWRKGERTPTANVVRPKVEKPGVGAYWLNTDSNVRHNRECRYFRRTTVGRMCGPNEGKPCGRCGG